MSGTKLIRVKTSVLETLEEARFPEESWSSFMLRLFFMNTAAEVKVRKELIRKRREQKEKELVDDEATV